MWNHIYGIHTDPMGNQLYRISLMCHSAIVRQVSWIRPSGGWGHPFKKNRQKRAHDVANHLWIPHDRMVEKIRDKLII